MRMRGWAIGMLAAAVMGLAGAGCLMMAKITPWYDDYEAYRAREIQIEAMDAPPGRRFGKPSARAQAFIANQQAHGTNKWLFADLGYLLATWSVVAFMVTGIAGRHGWRAFSHTITRAMTVVPLALLGAVGLAVSLVAGLGHAVGRQQVPMWNDGLIRAVLWGTQMIVTAITPVFLMLTVLPVLLRRRVRGPLLILSQPPHWAALMVTVLYLPILLIGAALIVFSYNSGGWATSITGALWIWLSLNARALWINPRAA